MSVHQHSMVPALFLWSRSGENLIDASQFCCCFGAWFTVFLTFICTASCSGEYFSAAQLALGTVWVHYKKYRRTFDVCESFFPMFNFGISECHILFFSPSKQVRRLTAIYFRISYIEMCYSTWQMHMHCYWTTILQHQWHNDKWNPNNLLKDTVNANVVLVFMYIIWLQLFLHWYI